jgi:hypothetical protein
MDGTIDVPIPLDPEAARALDQPERRGAAGLYLSAMLHHGSGELALAEAMYAIKRELRANGVTDEMVDEEIEAWLAERHG